MDQSERIQEVINDVRYFLDLDRNHAKNNKVHLLDFTPRVPGFKRATRISAEFYDWVIEWFEDALSRYTYDTMDEVYSALEDIARTLRRAEPPHRDFDDAQVWRSCATKAASVIGGRRTIF